MRERHYQLFEEMQKERGIDVGKVKEALDKLEVETPSWGFSDSGTRFKVFEQEGVPRDIFEKIDDAAHVHKMTGLTPRVAIHIPWDKVDNYSELKTYAEDRGVGIGAVNPNLFQDDDYKFGSVTNSDPAIRRKATDQLLECVEIARKTGSKELSLWFADGTNYPGQGDFRQRKHWMHEALRELYEEMDEDMRMLIEYKFFEPAFYHTDLADWGMSYNLAQKLGPKAQVLVDTGHHPQGTNIEHIVAYLMDEEKLGGFHFNSRKYADDDMIVAAHNPYEIFLTFYQIVTALHASEEEVRKGAEKISYMLDQAHNIEPKIPAIIRSLTNVQTLFAKALLVDLDKVEKAQQENDVMAAEQAVKEAFEIDVTPLLQKVREEKGLPIDPMQAHKESGYQKEIEKRGKGGTSL